MERRWGPRKPIEVDVIVDNQPASLVPGCIGDISIGGLYVRTEATNLRMHSQIELVLMLQQDDGTRVYRLPAMVVRLTANGAGLMFDQYDVNAFRTLVVLLLAKQKAAMRATMKRSLPNQETSQLKVFVGDGTVAASIKEGSADAALAATAAVPVSPQPSPVMGEPH